MEYTDLKKWVTDVADAIKEKKESTEKIKPINFPQEITALGTDETIVDTSDSPSLKTLTTRTANAIRTKLGANCSCESCKETGGLIKPIDFPEHIRQISLHEYNWVIWRNDSQRALYYCWEDYILPGGRVFKGYSGVVPPGNTFAAQLPVGTVVRINEYLVCDYLISSNCSKSVTETKGSYFDTCLVWTFQVSENLSQPHFIQQVDKYFAICDVGQTLLEPKYYLGAGVGSQLFTEATSGSISHAVTRTLYKDWRNLYITSSKRIYMLSPSNSTHDCGARRYFNGSNTYVCDFESAIYNVATYWANYYKENYFTSEKFSHIFKIRTGSYSRSGHSSDETDSYNEAFRLKECSCDVCKNRSSFNQKGDNWQMSKFIETIHREVTSVTVDTEQRTVSVETAEDKDENLKTFSHNIDVILVDKATSKFDSCNHSQSVSVFEYSDDADSPLSDGGGSVIVYSYVCPDCGQIVESGHTELCEDTEYDCGACQDECQSCNYGECTYCNTYCNSCNTCVDCNNENYCSNCDVSCNICNDCNSCDTYLCEIENELGGGDISCWDWNIDGCESCVDYDADDCPIDDY